MTITINPGTTINPGMSLTSQSYPPIVSNGLVYNIDAGNSSSYPGTGSTWYDLTNSDYDAILVSHVLFQNGYFYNFGTAQNISIPDLPAPGTNDFTFSFWVKLDDVNNTQSLLDIRIPDFGLLIRVNPNNTSYMITFQTTTESPAVGFSKTLTTSTWYNIVVVRSNNVVSAYINGVAGNNTGVLASNISGASSLYALGTWYNTAGQNLLGKLAVFTAYNRALSPSEVLQNFNALRTRFGAELFNKTQPVSSGLVMHLDAGNIESYPRHGTKWYDLVSSKEFTLYGTANQYKYSFKNGGSINFNPQYGHYAQATSLPSTLSNWTVEAWLTYDPSQMWVGGSPCIVTEVYNGNPINFTLGNTSDSFPNIQVGSFNGGWASTPGGVTLTPGPWYQLVGTWDGSTMKLYKNGILASSQTYGAGVHTTQRGGVGIRLMRRWDVAHNMGGKLAIVRIYNNDIGSTGVTQNYSANRTRFGL